MEPQEVFFWSLTLWSYFKSIRAKKSTFRDFMFYVTPSPNWYKERSINENPRSILLFALTEYFAYTKNDRLMKIQEVLSYSLWLYLFIFIFIILRKESTFRDFIRFDSHKLFKWKPWPRLTQTQQYTDSDLSISQHAQWRTMKTFHCVSINDTHHSTRHYFI